MQPFTMKKFARALSAAAMFSALSGCLLQQARTDVPEKTSRSPDDTASTETAQPVQPPLPPKVEKVQAAPPEDMWERIRLGMRLEGRKHEGVKDDLDWYARHQKYLDRVAERARPYLHLIVDKIENEDMPSEIALLPIVESAFQPFAYSHGRAAGLWQFIPGTGRRFDLKQTWWYDGRRDVAESTRAALEYLKYLHGHFDGDWLLALAAYNSGEGTVQRAIRKNRRRGKPTDFWHLDLPRETRGYVPRLLAISEIVAHPDKYGVSLKPIPNEPFLTTVEIGSQIDLALAAELAGVSLEDIYRYNPAFNRWATDPKGPHRLLIPVDKAETLKTALAEVPDERRIKWVRHHIRSGENLGVIASKYHTTVRLLRSVNELHGSTIRAGDSLVVPVARTELAHYRLTSDQRLKRTQQRERSGSKVEYVVRSGDTLWEIARRFEVGVHQLAKWNGMAPRDVLRPGQRLVVWGQEKQASNEGQLIPANFTHPQSKAMRRRIGYVVRSGDSLARISRRFRVSVKDLQRWNGIKPNQYLHPGQRLTVYVDVRRQSGNI
jgi:membrane-bound lytic murein transglycosylase D